VISTLCPTLRRELRFVVVQAVLTGRHRDPDVPDVPAALLELGVMLASTNFGCIDPAAVLVPPDAG
jgi:hypothetical protein